MEFTHKGWFGLCPIYLRNTETECPEITARHTVFEWVFDLSVYIFKTYFLICEIVNPECEVSWPVRITGEGSFNRYVGETENNQ